jgi:1-acyl-sn-glycerol-3-phosphate acyltransferase
MDKVRGALFWLVFGAGCLVLLPLAMLAAAVNERWMASMCHTWAAWWVWCARVCCGIRLVVRGRIPDAPVIVAMKHQSFYDAILTLYLFRWPAVVMKEELRRIPVWGWTAHRHGSIFVARQKGGAALRAMLRTAKAFEGSDRPVIIFPEGRRVEVGEAPPLKAGLSALYATFRRPIAPMAADAGRFWLKGLAKRPGTVTVAFGPWVEAGMPREEMEARVHALINEDPRTAAVTE